MSKKSSKEGRRSEWMIKELLEKLKKKKEVNRMWKRGQATWEKFQNIVRVFKGVMRKAKVHLELNLTRDVKNKEDFFKYITTKRKAREDVGPLLNKVGVLVMKDTTGEGGVTECLLCFSLYS